MTITIHDNFYNIRSRQDIPPGKLTTINSLIGEIGMSHYGLKWIYMVDSKIHKDKFALILNGDHHKLIAEHLTLNDVQEHLWTILRTLELFKKELKINDSWIMSTMKRETIETIYEKVKGEKGSFTQKAENSIVGTIKGEYQV